MVGRSSNAYTLFGIPSTLIPYQFKRALSWPFNVADNKQMHLGLRTDVPIFLPDLNQI